MTFAADSEELSELVFVEIGHKRYAFPTEWVEEVLPIVEPTPVPSWPADVLGVINVRGSLLPLVDIAPIIGHLSAVIKTSTLTVVVAAFGRRWGLVVDAVEGVGAGRISRGQAGTHALATHHSEALMLGVTVEANGAVVVVLAPSGLLHSFQHIRHALVETVGPV